MVQGAIEEIDDFPQLIRPYGWTLEFSNSVIKNMKVCAICTLILTRQVSNPIAWNFQTGGDNLVRVAIEQNRALIRSVLPLEVDPG
jgi:hypothetical protein